MQECVLLFFYVLWEKKQGTYKQQMLITIYMVFQNEWDKYNLHYLINQSSYNNEISQYMYETLQVCL